LVGEAIHRLLRSEDARVHVADVLPPELRELGIVGHVDAGRGPEHAIRRAVELYEAPELGCALSERSVADVGVADDGEADVALLQRSGLGDGELPVEPGRLAAIDRRRLEQRPRAASLVA